MTTIADLYTSYNSDLLNRALRYTSGNAEDAEDLVMQVWTDATRAWTKQAPEGNPLHWLLLVLKRRAADRSLRRERRPAITATDPETVPKRDHEHQRPNTTYAFTWTGEDPADVVATRARWKECMAYLSPKLRQIVHLVYWEGMSVAKAASTLGISQIAAKTRLSRARKQLSGCLTDVE